MNTLKRQNQNKIDRIIRFYPRALFYTFALLTVLSIGSCRKNNFSINSPENIKTELQNWLSINGRNFTTGELLIKNSQGEYERKNLDWDNVTYFRINGYDYYEVPYSSLSRTGSFQSINNKNSSSEIQKNYSLVFQKNIHGETVARIKRVVYGDSLLAVKSGTKKYWAAIFFDDMVGESKSTWVLLSQKEQNPLQVFKTQSASISISSSSTTARKSVEGGDNCIVTTLPVSEYQCTGSNTSGDYNVTCGYVSVGYSVFSQCLRPPEEGGGEDNFQYTIYFNGGSRPNLNTTLLKDSLQGYPCAQSILNSYPVSGSCIEINQLIFDVFNLNNDVNLTYKVDLNLGRDSMINGYASKPTAGYDWYEQSIYFNPWVLENSTREFTASTIMHESIHAVIDYWRTRYQFSQNTTTSQYGIDSNQFKAMFPIFWDYKRELNDIELAQHNQMAEAYINSFITYLKKVNSNISNEMATALAWKGLQKTTVWKKRTDTTHLLQLIHIARRDNADSSLSNLYNLSKCQ